MKQIVAYFKDSSNELVHKVSWPTRKELSSSAVVVMFASLVIAVLVFLVDGVFERVMNFIY
jgi:preprotein translocase subunit SecE